MNRTFFPFFLIVSHTCFQLVCRRSELHLFQLRNGQQLCETQVLDLSSVALDADFDGNARLWVSCADRIHVFELDEASGTYVPSAYKPQCVVNERPVSKQAVSLAGATPESIVKSLGMAQFRKNYKQPKKRKSNAEEKKVE